MAQPAQADCHCAFDADALALAVGDQVFVRAEVRRLDHDGRVVTVIVPAILGEGFNYIAVPPSCLERRETRRGVLAEPRVIITEGR